MAREAVSFPRATPRQEWWGRRSWPEWWTDEEKAEADRLAADAERRAARQQREWERHAAQRQERAAAGAAGGQTDGG